MKRIGMDHKALLREAMKGLLPDAILNRPKMGFPVPFSHWMRTGWNRWRATCCSTGAPVSAASSIRQPSTGCCAAMPPDRPTTAIGSGAC